MGAPFGDGFLLLGHEAAGSPVGVSAKDSEVLRLIEEEELTSFTFEGLKRRVGAHPETLSRSLNRLEELNILERADGAYRLTARGRELLDPHPLARAGGAIPLLRTMLPPTVPIEGIFANLKGRWFGQLRWLGYSDTAGDVVLKWVTADGAVQLDAKLSEGELTIEGRLLQGGNRTAAIRASHELLAHISRTYAGSQSRRRLMFDLSPQPMLPN
jgi:hypothetical protein